MTETSRTEGLRAPISAGALEVVASHLKTIQDKDRAPAFRIRSLDLLSVGRVPFYVTNVFVNVVRDRDDDFAVRASALTALAYTFHHGTGRAAVEEIATDETEVPLLRAAASEILAGRSRPLGP